METNNEKMTEVTEKNVTQTTETTTSEKGSVEFQKMSRLAAIAAVVLAVILVIGIIVTNTTGLHQIKESIDVELGTVKELSLNAKDFFNVDDEIAKKIAFDDSEVDLTKVGEYEVIATYKGRDYTIKVIVKDTKAPSAQMALRYIFTNDATNVKNLDSLIKKVKDASDYTLNLVRFKKINELVELNDHELKNVTDKATTFAKAEDALAVGTEETPAEPGIYRSILEIADESGNASYEEVIVILDTTAALITDVEDQVIEVAKDKLNEQPEINKNLYKAVDNVDGLKTGDDLTYELSLRDEAKHEWIVKVSYTDRAGNESFGEFLITVKEKKASSNGGSGNKNNSGSNNSNNGNTGSNNGNSNTGNSGSNNGNSNAGNSNSGSNNSNSGGTTYPPNYNSDADTDKDGMVSADEEMRYITPEKQACIDAGYGVVCEFDGGTWYGVLMKDNEHTINGKTGREILREYLNERGMDGLIDGCWINSDNGWYWYTTDEVYEIGGEEDEGDWA